MQYFQAVQIGKQRAGKSQMKLFEVAGFAMLTLTTKKVNGKFMPVDQEDYVAIIQKQDSDGGGDNAGDDTEKFITLIADKDGFTKAQTKPLDKDEALTIFNKLKGTGMAEFSGDGIEIWTESYPTVHKTIK